MDPLIGGTVSLFVGGLFVAGAVHKIAKPVEFRAALDGYRSFGPLAPALATAVPLAEFSAGSLAMLLPFDVHRLGLAACIAFLLAYSALILSALWRGLRYIDCGCFGFGAQRAEIRPSMAIRNIALASVGGLALVFSASRPLLWLDWAGIVAGASAAALISVATEFLLLLPRKLPS